MKTITPISSRWNESLSISCGVIHADFPYCFIPKIISVLPKDRAFRRFSQQTQAQSNYLRLTFKWFVSAIQIISVQITWVMRLHHEPFCQYFIFCNFSPFDECLYLSFKSLWELSHSPVSRYSISPACRNAFTTWSIACHIKVLILEAWYERKIAFARSLKWSIICWNFVSSISVHRGVQFSVLIVWTISTCWAEISATGARSEFLQYTSTIFPKKMRNGIYVVVVFRSKPSQNTCFSTKKNPATMLHVSPLEKSSRNLDFATSSLFVSKRYSIFPYCLLIILKGLGCKPCYLIAFIVCRWSDK